MLDDATPKTKMLSGERYPANDPELLSERGRAKALCTAYNQTVAELDRATLHGLFGYPADAYLEPPFFCDDGYNIRFSPTTCDAAHGC